MTKPLGVLRVAAGISQKDAAKVIGVSQSTISMWENGASRPSIDKVFALSRLYACSETDILRACATTDTDKPETENGCA